MGFVRIFWKNNVQEAFLPRLSISGQVVPEIIAQLCSENSDTNPSKFFRGRPQKNLEGFVRRNAYFWQVGLLDIVLSEYPDKSYNVRNFIFMTSHFSALYTSSVYHFLR